MLISLDDRSVQAHPNYAASHIYTLMTTQTLKAVEPITDYCYRYFIELQFFLESSGEQCQHDSKSVKDP